MGRMSATRLFLRSALFLAFVLVTALLVVPRGTLDRIHSQFLWLGRSDAWLTSVVPGLDLDHLAAFAAIGFLAPLAGVRAGGLGYLLAYGMVGGSALTPALSRREREEYQSPR
jgi:hypothetical protein